MKPSSSSEYTPREVLGGDYKHNSAHEYLSGALELYASHAGIPAPMKAFLDDVLESSIKPFLFAYQKGYIAGKASADRTAVLTIDELNKALGNEGAAQFFLSIKEMNKRASEEGEKE